MSVAAFPGPATHLALSPGCSFPWFPQDLNSNITLQEATLVIRAFFTSSGLAPVCLRHLSQRPSPRVLLLSVSRS